MAGQKRTDNKGRILKDNETQRKDGTYRFTYTDADGKRHDVYSRRLVPTDRLPPGCKDDLSLREKERKILRDLEDGIKATVENRATLNDLFNLYISNKPELKQSTRANYLARRKSQALSIQMSRLTITASSESVDLSPIPWKSFTPSSTLSLRWPCVMVISVSIPPPALWQKSRKATIGKSQSVTL